MKIKVDIEKLKELLEIVDCTDHGYCPWYYDGCRCARDCGVFATKTCVDLGFEWLEGE